MSIDTVPTQQDAAAADQNSNSEVVVVPKPDEASPLTTNAAKDSIEGGCVPDDSFICPLTLSVMIDPVMSVHGHNYEREAILEWLHLGNDTCPVTRKPLQLKYLISNRGLKQKINDWQKQNEMEVVSLPDTDEARMKRLGLFFVDPTQDEKLESEGRASPAASGGSILRLLRGVFRRSPRAQAA